MEVNHTDPRVQLEIENLNTSTEFINKLELELEKARSDFSKLLAESTHKIEILSQKLSSSITKARPYYEAQESAQELRLQAQQEALKYENTVDEQEKIKAVVHEAEQNLANENIPKWQEMLTASADDVNKLELEKLALEKKHEMTSRAYNLTELRLSKLHKQLKRSIVKSSLEIRRNLLDINNFANQHQLQLLPFFEMKVQFNQMLDEQLAHIRSYEDRLNKAKSNYSKAMERLEELNNRIYETKQDDDDCKTTAEEGKAGDNFDNIYDDQTLNELILDDTNIDTILHTLHSQYAQHQS